MARTLKLTANAGPMPAPFPIVSQTDRVQHHATKAVLSEHKCHGMPFALSTKRSGFSASAVYQWFSSFSMLGMKNAKGGWASGECIEAFFNQRIAGICTHRQTELIWSRQAKETSRFRQ